MGKCVSKNGLILVLVGLALAAPVLALSKHITILPSYQTPKINHHVAPRTVAKLKRNRLTSWIDHLAIFECNGCGPHYRRVDSNGYYSYGCLQFQRGTFDAYSHLLHVGGDIYDCATQKALAYAMISYKYGNWIHWKTSVIDRNLGLPPV